MKKQSFLKKMLFAGSLAIASLAITAPAQALTFSFGSTTGPRRQATRLLEFNNEGLTVIATGEVLGVGNIARQRNVFQNRTGLGVTPNLRPRGESNLLDGRARPETLNLRFEQQQVSLLSATFRNVINNSEFKLLVDGSEFVTDIDVPNSGVFSFLSSSQGAPTGSMFSFTVPNVKDGYLLSAIEVTPVPTPAAVLPTLVSMGVAALKKKQKPTEEAER